MMRGAIRWIVGILAIAVTCVPLGMLVALGPVRLAKLDASLGSLGASLGVLVILAVLITVWYRATRRWWSRTLTFVLGLALIAVVASPFAIAMWAAHPSHALIPESRPDFAVDLAVPCGDATLSAWVMEGSTDAAVIVAHGSGSTKSSVIDQATVVNQAGYTVVLLDARGHGDSGGTAMDLGWWGESDIRCAIDAVTDAYPSRARHIGVLGLSMGGEEAIGAAGVDPRIEAVVAEGATARTAADKDGWLPHGPLGSLQRILDIVRDETIDVLSDAPAPATLQDSAKRSEAPMLLIVAGDVPSEADAAAWIAEGNPRVATWVVDGSPHTGGLATDPSGWTRSVVDFFDTHLG